MTKTTYSQKLLDPRWQRRRLEVLNRDNFTCRVCGDTESTLHVHHLKYQGNPWDISLDDLLTVCQNCHASEHGKTNSPKQVPSIPILQRDYSQPPTIITHFQILNLDYSADPSLFKVIPKGLHNMYCNYVEHSQLNDEDFNKIFQTTRVHWVDQYIDSINEFCLRSNVQIVASDGKILGVLSLRKEN